MALPAEVASALFQVINQRYLKTLDRDHHQPASRSLGRDPPTHAELRHVRTRVRTPGQNGSRERGFGTIKYERLSHGEIVASGYAD